MRALRSTACCRARISEKCAAGVPTHRRRFCTLAVILSTDASMHSLCCPAATLHGFIAPACSEQQRQTSTSEYRFGCCAPNLDLLPDCMRSAIDPQAITWKSSGRSSTWRNIENQRRLKWSRKGKLVAIGIVNMEETFSPRCILRTVGIESFLVAAVPEYIHVGEVKNHPVPNRHPARQIGD